MASFKNRGQAPATSAAAAMALWGTKTRPQMNRSRRLAQRRACSALWFGCPTRRGPCSCGLPAVRQQLLQVLAGCVGRRSSTSRRYANVSMPRCLHVAVKLNSTAAVLPPLSLPTNNQLIAAHADQLQRPLAHVVVDVQVAVGRVAVQRLPLVEHVVDRRAIGLLGNTCAFCASSHWCERLPAAAPTSPAAAAASRRRRRASCLGLVLDIVELADPGLGRQHTLRVGALRVRQTCCRACAQQPTSTIAPSSRCRCRRSRRKRPLAGNPRKSLRNVGRAVAGMRRRVVEHHAGMLASPM